MLKNLMQIALSIVFVLFIFAGNAQCELLSFSTDVEAELQLWFWTRNRDRWITPPFRLTKGNSPMTTDLIDDAAHFLVIRIDGFEKRVGWISGKKLREVSAGKAISIDAVIAQEEKRETYTVNVISTEQVQGTRTVLRSVTEPEEQFYTVMVPFIEERNGLRSTICRPQRRTRTVMVTKQITEDVPYTYSVSVVKPETRIRQIKVRILKDIKLIATQPGGTTEVLEFTEKLED